MSAAVADKLDEARALIERGWTQGAPARNERGFRVGAKSPDAVCWCALGAVQASCDGIIGIRQIYDILRQATRSGNDFGAIALWNDAPGRTQAEVVEAFRKAAELARADGQ